ncbi:MAG: hypothetical protein GWP08_07255 [Nitrospiraceae bacterium]|nr:hypothetical protein [Nitrospiraceae bacterium]
MTEEPIREAKSGHPWLWGCGIGCGVLIIVAGLVVAGGVVFVGRQFDKARVEAMKEIETNLAEARAAETLSAEEDDVYTELLELVKREEATFLTAMAAMMFLGIGLEAEDEEAAEALEAAKELVALLREHPDAGMTQLGELMARHPGIDQDFKTIVEKQQQQQLDLPIAEHEAPAEIKADPTPEAGAPLEPETAPLPADEG